MAEPDKIAAIQKMIKSGAFSRWDSRSNIGCEASDFHKCNLFVNKAAKLWNVTLPKLKDRAYQGKTFGGGKTKDWPENPLDFIHLQMYMEAREQLNLSGVRRVTSMYARSLANQGKLVLALGDGHITIAAPNKKMWPLVFRPDQSFRRGDKRLKVGVKDRGKNIDFYEINPEEYQTFNSLIQKMGLSERDIYARQTKKERKGYYDSPANENYHRLRKLFLKIQR